MDTYRVGLLGVGPRGLSQARAYMLHPRTELVALSDIDTKRLATAAAEFGLERTYTEYREMLDRENLDVINIPTRTNLHAPLTLGVLEHRAPKVVVLEKPMATRLVDADQMIERAEATGARLAVHHQNRTSPSFQVAERLINAGEIGPLTSIKIRGKGYYGGYDLLNIETHVLNATRRFAGEVHSVMAMCQTGGRPTRVDDIVEGPNGFGLIAGEDISAMYAFANGLNVFAEVHHRSVPSDGWIHIKIYGEEGAICLFNARELFVRHQRDAVVGDVPWEKHELADTDRYLHGYDYYGEFPGVQDADDFWMVEETVRMLDEDREHECDGHEGRAVMEMMEGTWQSHFAGRRVEFPLTQREHPLHRERVAAGLPVSDPDRAKLRYAEWLPGERERIARAAMKSSETTH